MKRLTKEQRKALSAFYEYISCDSPFTDMSKSEYKSLGKLYDHLPKEVFVKPRVKSLYHVSCYYNPKRKKLTDSGVLSCTTRDGMAHIKDEWVLGSSPWFSVTPIKAVCAKRLYNLAKKHIIPSKEGLYHVEHRVINEREYILKLSDVEVVR